MESLDNIIKKKKVDVGKKFVTKEFQDFGIRIAERLNDMAHKSLYIKMAKTKDRTLLSQALSYTLDYPNASNPARIFMWKVKQIQESAKEETATPEKN